MITLKKKPLFAACDNRHQRPDKKPNIRRGKKFNGMEKASVIIGKRFKK